MIKLLIALISGLAYSGQAPAQVWDAADMGSAASPAGEVAQDNPVIYPPAMNSSLAPWAAPHKHDQRLDRSSLGRPVVVLPMPMGGGSGYNNMHGFQYPGSYMPRDTPLHKFNGYVACNPPDLAGETEAAKATAGAPVRRMVKITSTRSLAAPEHQQPCPVYTINGEMPKKQQSYTTTTSPSGPNAPRTMR